MVEHLFGSRQICRGGRERVGLEEDRAEVAKYAREFRCLATSSGMITVGEEGDDLAIR